MAKDRTDTATIDLLNPNPHGGFRRGAGRKKSVIQKVKIGWHITKEARDHLETLVDGKPYSPSELIDYLIKNTQSCPSSLD